MENSPTALSSSFLAESDVTGTALPFVPSLRRESNVRPPSLEELRKELEQEIKEEFTVQEKTDVWKQYAKAVETHHDQLIGRWQKEMDNLLIYASLFSAVLTAFNVQSYQLLQPQPTDPSLAVLQQISQQLSSFSVGTSFVNSTHPARPLSEIQPRFHAPASAIWINILWFSSLICSLASVSIALMVQQWLHDVSIGLSGTSPQHARRRQYRHDVLLKWRVDIIVLIPSILVQFALVLFLSGLLVLLWTLHHTVAIVGTSLVGTLFIFLITVVSLPLFRWDCCYRSPQAQAIYVLVRQALRAFASILHTSVESPHSLLPHSRPLQSLLARISSPRRIILKMPTWRGREERHVSNAHGALGCKTAVMAFTTTFDIAHLHKLHVVLPDFDAKQLASCFDDIVTAHREQWGSHAHVTDRFKKTVLMRPLVYAVRCLCMREPRLKTPRKELDRLCGLILDQVHPAYVQDMTECALTTLSLVAMDDAPLGKAAWDKMHATLRLRRAENRLSYRSIRYVMAACQWYFDKWIQSGGKVPLDGESFVDHQLRPIGAIFACVTDALSSESDLAPEEAQAVCSRARSVLSTFQRNLGSLDWEGLLQTFSSPYSGTGTRRRTETNVAVATEGPHSRPRSPPPPFECGLKFVTWLRSRLEENVVEPLLALCQHPRCAEVVSEDVIVSLQSSWSAAKTAVGCRRHLYDTLPRDINACPALMESLDGRYMPVDSRRSIQEFEAKLGRLREMVVGERDGLLLAKPSISVQVPSPARSIAALPPT